MRGGLEFVQAHFKLLLFRVSGLYLCFWWVWPEGNCVLVYDFVFIALTVETELVMCVCICDRMV